jgi:integrase
VKRRIDAEILKLQKADAVKRGEDPAAVEPIPGWTLHDLRRTGASGMAPLGVQLHVVEKILNHSSGSFRGVAGIYQRYDFAKEKRAALDAWASYVESLVSGKQLTNVVPMSRGAR